MQHFHHWGSIMFIEGGGEEIMMVLNNNCFRRVHRDEVRAFVMFIKSTMTLSSRGHIKHRKCSLLNPGDIRSACVLLLIHIWPEFLMVSAVPCDILYQAQTQTSFQHRTTGKVTRCAYSSMQPSSSIVNTGKQSLVTERLR